MHKELEKFKWPGYGRCLACAAALFVILGALLSWWIAAYADSAMRKDQLLQVRMVAEAVNIKRVATLTSTAKDLGQLDYLRLKEQFAAVCASNPQCRFIYLMGRKADGSIFFLVDSEPSGSKSYSPPGQLYGEVPKEYVRVFDSASADVVGPVRDRWGEWISSLVPLKDPQTGAVLAVLGMDINASDWKWELAKHILPFWLLLALLLAIVFIYLLLRRTNAGLQDKQAEIQAKEKRFREVIENSLVASYKRDLKSDVYDYLSPVFAKISGYAHEDMVQMPLKGVMTLIHEQDRPVVERIIDRAVKASSGDEFRVEYRFRHKDGQYRWLLDQFRVLRDNAGEPVARIGSVSDITEMRTLSDAVRRERQRLAGIIRGTRVGTWEWNVQTGETLFNDRWAEIIGYTLEEIWPVSIKTWEKYAHPDDLKASGELLEKHFRGELDFYEFESRMRHKDGSWVWVLDRGQVISWTHDGKPLMMMGTHEDISVRKQDEIFRRLDGAILAILNGSQPFPEIIHSVISEIKAQTGVDAVGVRLQDGEDFPYYSQGGFSKEFLLTENTLLGRAADGGICRDSNGNVKLECTCGLVISGKTDPANPLFTRGGSCWTNNSFPLLDLPKDQDPRFHPRNQCIHQGYASIALVPIRAGLKIVGLIHLSDRRKGYFTLSVIEYLEGISGHIGEALLRRSEEEKLRIGELKYRSLFNSSEVGMFVSKLDGSAIVDMNDKFLSIFGYSREEMLGKHSTTHWAVPAERKEMVRRLQAEGCVVDFECKMRNKQGEVMDCLASLRLDKDLEVMEGSIIDISARKRAYQELQQSEEKFHLLLNSAAEAIYGLDMNGNCTFCNNAFLQMLGYRNPEELMGKNMHLQIHSKRSDGTPFPIEECPIFQAFKQGESVHVDNEVLWRADGTSFDAEYWSYPQRKDGVVVGAVVTFLNVSERKRLEKALALNQEQLRQLSITDELTGLYNRRGFFEIARKHFDIAKRYKQPLTLLYADLDGLKITNDTRGHEAGDQAIKDVARILMQSVRSSDVAARIGGDEFVVLLPLSDHKAGEATAVRVQAALQLINTERTHPISVSIGVRQADLNVVNSVDELVAMADADMYRAKAHS